jgi:hypothetical protein
VSAEDRVLYLHPALADLDLQIPALADAPVPTQKSDEPALTLNPAFADNQALTLRPAFAGQPVVAV